MVTEGAEGIEVAEIFEKINREYYRRIKSVKAVVDKEKCIGCGQCVDVCPVNAIKLADGKADISDECIECGACVSTCSVGAISL